MTPAQDIERGEFFRGIDTRGPASLPMSDALLNENQRRRTVVLLRLLKEEMDGLASWPELLRPGEPYSGIRARIAEVLVAVEELRRVLALPPFVSAPLRARVMAIAGTWAIHADDLRASNLVGYGEVHPGLREVLDARVDGIAGLLRALSEQARSLPQH